MFNDTIFEIFPILESERLIFRRHTLEDVNDIYSIRSDVDCMKYMDSNLYTLEESKDFVIKNINSFDNKEGIGWLIVAKNSNEVIGDFSYWKLDKSNNR
jgi:ribosomal-protein-alanine N-acetyltransferase